MAIRFSDEATRLMAGDGGLRRALANAQMVFYTGSQPASANDSIGTAQPIIAFTASDLVWTPEVKGIALFDLTGIAAAETITSLKISGVEILGSTVTYATSATATALVLANTINAYVGAIDFVAVASGATVTVYAPVGVGDDLNLASVIATGTAVWNGAANHFTSGAEAANATPFTFIGNGRFGSGAGGNTAGVTAVNGLTFDVPVDGATYSPSEETFYIAKAASATWKGKNGFGPATAAATAVFTGIVTGSTYTAGWGRIYATSGDDGTATATTTNGYIRVDFSVGTSGTDFIMSPAATFTVNTTSGSEIESVINTFRLKINKKMA